RIRHRRVEALAAAAAPLAQGVDELLVGPGADPGVPVARDAGRHEGAEPRLDGPSAGELVAASRKRMTGGAIGDRSQIPPALDLREILWVAAQRRGGAGDPAERGERDGHEAGGAPAVRHAPAGPGS